MRLAVFVSSLGLRYVRTIAEQRGIHSSSQRPVQECKVVVTSKDVMRSLHSSVVISMVFRSGVVNQKQVAEMCKFLT